MKKVLIAKDLHILLLPQNSFLNRAGMQVFAVSSNEELLEVHRTVHADLIMTQLDLPGMNTEQVTSRIREDADMRSTPVLMVCPNTSHAIEQCGRCGAAAVIPRPVNPLVLLAKAQQLLAIAWRETFRALVNIVVEGHTGSSMFFCRSRDISVSGILLETDKHLHQGNTISCSFYLPESSHVQATAEVVRTVAPPDQKASRQYGMKFLQMNADHRRALEMFIHAKSLPS